MAASDNLASIEPWTFRQTFADSWISEAFARDTETLTKALQKSLSNHSSDADATDATMSHFFNPPEIPTMIQTQQSGGSGSDPETPASKRRIAIPVNGKPTKRKSRASKRTTTTFITADPANFRQMVQQVTGVRFSGNSQLPAAPVLLKPEPHRPSVDKMQQGCLPTLDTSAFLLDHHHRQVLRPTGTALVAQPSLNIPPPAFIADSSAGLDFDSFSSFPTLESWKVL